MTSRLRAAYWPRLVFPLLASSLALLSLAPAPLHAEVIGTHEFVIPASEGYGTSECLREQSACGRVIADAWCESHGHARSVGYMKAEDITASLGSSTRDVEIPHDAIIVSCGE